MPLLSSSSAVSWSDLIATKAERSGSGNDYLTEADKRARSIGSSLRTLVDAGLMVMTKGSGTLREVILLNETGVSTPANTIPYTPPSAQDDVVVLPGEFITNGWVHALEDSEINVLLMAACRTGGFIDAGWVAIPAHFRLQHYGISRDNYTRGLKTLQWFGLIEVAEQDRHQDGRADASTGQLLHRLKLNDAGFGVDALDTVQQVLDQQLALVTPRTPTPR